MPNRRVSLTTVKLTIFVYFEILGAISERVGCSINGGAVKERPSWHEELILTFRRYASDLIARRLKKNEKEIPLASAEDFEGFVSIVFEKGIVGRARAGDGYDFESYRPYLDILKADFLQVASGEPGVETRNAQYEKYWKWVDLFRAAASEKRVRPEKLAKIPGIQDELIRRFYTKRELTRVLLLPMNAHFNFDNLRQKLIRPMVEVALRNLLEITKEKVPAEEIKRRVDEKLEECTEEVLSKFLPEPLDRIRKRFTSAVQLEVERIYSSSN